MAAPASSTIVPGGPKERLVGAIRSWVHMDNLVENFNKQASNARTLRTKHETDAIQLMKQLGLTASTIQISGATLQLKRQKKSGDLTWGYLEKEIAAWCASAGVPVARGQSLFKWLQDHREQRETDVLTKLTTAPKPDALK